MRRKVKARKAKRQTEEERNLRSFVRKLQQQAAADDDEIVQLKDRIALLVAKAEREQPAFIWRTREGEQMRPSEMETSHLQNTICYLQRRLSWLFGNARWLASTEHLLVAMTEMLKEARRRGVQV